MQAGTQVCMLISIVLSGCARGCVHEAQAAHKLTCSF